MRDARFATVAGAVLVGGASSRMGNDKARLEIDGASGAARAARLLSGLFEQVLLVGGDPPADAPGERVPDPDGPVCALRGLTGALAASRAQRVLVLATDLPLLGPEVLLALVAYPEADAVVPRAPDGLQPLCAVYRREPVLTAARARLSAGELKLEDLLGAVETRYLEGADLALVDPDAVAFTNVNTPADLERARALLASRG